MAELVYCVCGIRVPGPERGLSQVQSFEQGFFHRCSYVRKKARTVTSALSSYVSQTLRHNASQSALSLRRRGYLQKSSQVDSSDAVIPGPSVAAMTFTLRYP